MGWSGFGGTAGFFSGGTTIGRSGIVGFCLPSLPGGELSAAVGLASRLKLIPNAISERVTYHDPCNIARQRWIIEQPRELLRAICSDYVDMIPNRDNNICCGGGGGTVSIDEIRPYRTAVGGRMKAEQLRATGAKYCVAPCSNCKKQLRELVEDQNVDCEIVGLHDLLYKAIDFLDQYGTSEEPFCLSVHYTAPHSPWSRENHIEEVFDSYADCAFDSIPREPPHPWNGWDPSPEERQLTLQGYFAAVT